LRFVAFILSFFFFFPGVVFGDVIFSTTDYSVSAIGVIKQNTVSLQNSFADGDIRLIPFNQSDSEIKEKLVVALRNSGTIEIYDRQKLTSPLVNVRAGVNIHSGVYYDSSLFLLDMGSYKGASALYKINPNNGKVSSEVKLEGDDPDYKFYAQKIFESGGALIVLMQRYKSLGYEFPYVEHMGGELLKISPDTLQIDKRWSVNKNPMDMVLFKGEVYIVSIGGAQGVTGNTPKLEVINAATESRREINLWLDKKIPDDMNEPQKITLDPDYEELYIAVSSVMDIETYQTKSSVYRFNPSDINTVSLFTSSPDGSITCIDYDSSNDTIVTLVSDFSTYSGSIKIYNKNGTINREYSSTELGGSAYQSILASNVGVEDVKINSGGGGCSSGIFPLWILLLALFNKLFIKVANTDKAKKKENLIASSLRSQKEPPSAVRKASVSRPQRRKTKNLTHFGVLSAMNFIILTCVFLASPTFAGVIQLPEETVSGSRIQDDSDYSPGSVTVVDVQKFAGEASDLPSLLDMVPGLQITRLRGRGQYTVASIRGSTSSQVAVYIDGQLANTGGDAAVDLSTIPFRNIERIEVYRGYVPARFGIAGIGGVINIITHKADEKTEFRFFTGMGSFGEKSASFSWTGKLFDGNFYLGSEYEGYTGDFPYKNDNATPENLFDDYDAHRLNNGFDRYNVIFKWEKNGFAFRSEWQKRYQELPLSAPGNDKLSKTSRTSSTKKPTKPIEPTEPPEPPESSEIPRTSGAKLTTEQLNLQLVKRFRVGEVDMGISVAWLDQNKEFEDPNMSIGSIKWNEYLTRRLSFGYNAAFKAGGRNLIEFIANYSDESLEGKLNGMKASSYQTNLVLQDTINIDAAGTILLSPLIRWNKADDDDELTWNIALSKQFRENLFLRTSYGSYVRIPNLYEKYGDGGILRASPLIKWERGKQWDIGFVWTGKALGGESRLGVTYFDRNADDLIEFVMFGPYIASYRNIGKASAKGVEFEAAWSSDTLTAEISAAYINSENLTNDYRYGMQLPNSPQWSLFARLDKKLTDKLNIFADVNYVSRNYLDYAQYISYQSLTTVGLGMKYKISENATLFARVNDLFDNGSNTQFIHTLTDKSTLAWYPYEGRSFHLSLQWKF
jgi:outer membrane cobalamin receptor